MSVTLNIEVVRKSCLATTNKLREDKDPREQSEHAWGFADWRDLSWAKEEGSAISIRGGQETMHKNLSGGPP